MVRLFTWTWAAGPGKPCEGNAVTAAHCFDEAADATAWNGGRREPIGAWSAHVLQLDVAYVAIDDPGARARRRTCGPVG